MAVLPPAPNWFSAQILRSSNDGHVAFGAKNSVVVLQCKPKAHFVGGKKTFDNPKTTHSKADGNTQGQRSDVENWRQAPTSGTR